MFRDMDITQPCSDFFYHSTVRSARSAVTTEAAEAAPAPPLLPGVSTWYFCCLLDGASFVSSMVTVPVPCSGAMPNDLRFQREKLRYSLYRIL